MKTATGLTIYLKSGKRRGFFYFLMILHIVFIAHIMGCTKDDTDKSGRDIEAPKVLSVNPADKSTIAVTATPEVIFSEAIDTSTLSLAFIVMQENTNVTGRISYSDMKATFIPLNPLNPSTAYTCTIKSSVRDISGNAMAANYSWTFTTGMIEDITPPEIIKVTPALNETSVKNDVNPSVTFSEEIDILTIISSSFILKQGNSLIHGTVSYSGKTATFTPSSALKKGTVYSATVTASVKDIAGNALASSYTWTFTTASDIDNTPPAILSVAPEANTTGVAVGVKPSVTFNELMNATTINSASFMLKRGATAVTGIVSYSGNTAMFTPSSALQNGVAYTATITTSVKDIAGNALASGYTWTFTTSAVGAVDNTPPSVTGVAPVSNATGIALSMKPSVTFSEPMNTSTFNSASFYIKQGSSTLSGTISWSGNTATFTPSAALLPQNVYTATVTTAVKDLAGNALVSNYTWTFTTAAANISFSADVVPILNLCNTCHKHSWTPSSTPSVFHSNLVSSGHITPSAPTNGKIYKKLDGGHPSSTITAAQKSKIMTWILEGSKNN